MDANFNRSYAQRDSDSGEFSWNLLIISSVVALFAAIWPLPLWSTWIRPEFLALLVAYWVMMAPFRVGMVYAFVMGLLLDLFAATPLGQQALGLTVIAYLVFLIHQRMRMFSILQQSLLLFGLVSLYQLLKFWIYGLSGGAYASFALLLPALSSAICWPFVRLFMDRLRR
ncbi:MAG: rod shape-determining protein MreD [Gammaproteobacteria bacterium]|nr:rod shape-determining protein MreD [Gammaproteobacteria bacterium]NND39155.1 rod shape-determining protein MreD [Pseudomonadales bacterium]MBT8152028.1 rod shape-determining protein MreD [Gammaproteobacteria bacterium]NNL11079.1 rod shape-determining protein MreD [Pseudomonadales bacterium]NNM12542.1 rod shape-determining protein MreD [Pseudomonadales bacterium]